MLAKPNYFRGWSCWECVRRGWVQAAYRAKRGWDIRNFCLLIQEYKTILQVVECVALPDPSIIPAKEELQRKPRRTEVCTIWHYILPETSGPSQTATCSGVWSVVFGVVRTVGRPDASQHHYRSSNCHGSITLPSNREFSTVLANGFKPISDKVHFLCFVTNRLNIISDRYHIWSMFENIFNCIRG